MPKSKGERAIEREEKRKQKEEKRRIKEANKMLIPTSKKTKESLKIESFDPQGTFKILGNRWLRIYELEELRSSGFAEILGEIEGRVRITRFLKDKESLILTIMEEGDIHDEVRKKFTSDEESLRNIFRIRWLSVDEAINLIAFHFKEERLSLSYASLVRGKRDLRKEIFSEVIDNGNHFVLNGMYGSVISFLQIPGAIDLNMDEIYKNLGCAVYISYDFKGIDLNDQDDYKRALEKKYGRRRKKETEEFLNASVMVGIVTDSRDALEILEKTLNQILMRVGFFACAIEGEQKEDIESILSFDLVDASHMTNVSKEVANVLLGGGAGDQNPVSENESM